MQKLVKRMSLVMAALMIAFTALSNVPAKAAAIPQLQLVGAQKTEYTAGDRVSFTVNAPNYAGKIQYRAVLYSAETKTYKDLWNTADKYYTGWVPSGPTVFTIGWPINEPGTYRITVYAKRAYLANSKTAMKGSNCDTALPGIVFTVKAAGAVVDSIAPVADVNVTKGDAEVLPKTVTLNMSDKTTKTANVTWDDVDTTKVGEYTVSGKVEGTDKKATVKVIVAAFAVSGVTAPNASTLVVTGTGLNKLTKEAIKIAGNAATSVTASADNKSATVTLDGKLAPNTNTVVNITDESGAKDYTVTNGYVVNSVVVNATTFDDDRANQFVTFKVNGDSANADLSYLTISGHSVTFVATDAVTNTAANIFVGGGNTSATGALITAVPVGKYNIEVQVTRAGVATVSGKAVITVTNLDATSTAIDSVRFVNGLANAETGYSVTTLLNDDFIMNSTTLVAGEEASITRVRTIMNGAATTLPATAAVKVTSSNPAVISVAQETIATFSTWVLAANSAGTATITVEFEGVTKAYTFTVTNNVRKLTSVKPGVSKVDLIVSKSTSVDIETFDQYGDPFAVAAGTTALAVAPQVAVDEVVAINALGQSLHAALDVDTDAANSIGSQTATLTATTNAGIGTLYFKDKNGTVLGSLLVNVTSVDNVATQKLEIIPTATSTDNTITFASSTDSSVQYGIANYNSQGIFSGYQALATYTVTVVDPTVATVTKNANDFDIFAADISLVGATTKTTAVIVKNAASEIVANFTVTVNYAPYKISGVQFKTAAKVDYIGKALNASDVLDLVASNDDDVVNGITLNKATSSKVRLAENMAAVAGIQANDLYLDLDNNGVASAGDVKLGTIVASVASGSTFAPALVANTTTAYNNGTGIYTRTTASGDKGTIIISIRTNVADPTTAIAGTAITVDVK